MIHEKALIDPSAIIGKSVTIGPFSVIGPNVEIGEGTVIGPHVVINGPTKIGRFNKIFQFSSIGEETQDKKYKDGDATFCEIGDHNVIREFVTINRGTVQDRSTTTIGNHCLLMAYVHVAHDCVLGNYVTFSNNASLAGHVVVEDYASLGGFVGVHQFCRIGRQSFSAGGSIILKDVPPFVMAAGYPATLSGLNSVGLKRSEMTDETLAGLKQAYRTFFRQGLTVDEAAKAVRERSPNNPDIEHFVQFIVNSERGVTR